ncbi:MAG: hypothetical protein H6729_00950 [Deltaproteobacteria bacterium]|nr:hypothetical protein [Deltaproteobacteria bacterium]
MIARSVEKIDDNREYLHAPQAEDLFRQEARRNRLPAPRCAGLVFLGTAVPSTAAAQGSINALGDGLHTGLLAIVVAAFTLVFSSVTLGLRRRILVRIMNGALGASGIYLSHALLNATRDMDTTAGLFTTLLGYAALLLSVLPELK